MSSISAIEGIGRLYAQKLSEHGVKTVSDLLETCATPQGRKQLAQTTGIREEKLLCWANKADLFRIKGISTQYSDLLEAIGVVTIGELRHHNPENLLETMRVVNATKKLVRQVPALSQVRSFVSQAQSLDLLIMH